MEKMNSKRSQKVDKRGSKKWNKMDIKLPRLLKMQAFFHCIFQEVLKFNFRYFHYKNRTKIKLFISFKVFFKEKKSLDSRN